MNVNLVGGYDVPGLAGRPPITERTVSTGVTTGALPVQKVPVNHLAARYLKLQRGASAAAVCHAATLSLTVGLPAGINAKPSFFSRSLGAVAVPLSVNGNTATLAVPGHVLRRLRRLPVAAEPESQRGRARLRRQRFTQRRHHEARHTAGPAEPLWTGPTVAGPSGEVAPSILVFGAQIVRVPTATRAVRLIVFSSGPGKLQAALGSSPLRTFALRAGNNDVRFRLPASAVKALRKTASARAASVLRLTSFSTDGAKGATVTRKLTVTRATRR